jgi:homoserine O-acetyltransferase
VTNLFYSFDELQLENGGHLGPVTLAYRTWGELNAERSNAILICHALTGDARVAGLDDNGVPGWWDDFVGPGKAFDTAKYFVICSNVLGGCSGSIGPASPNPATGKPYGLQFPVVTVHDMVAAQEKLVSHLGIKVLYAVAGGSMGGMQVLAWSRQFPERLKNAICIATNAHHSPQQIAWNEVGRQAIMADPDWNGGEYYDEIPPAAGLSLARMVGHITYLSEESLEHKFARRLQDKDRFSYNFEAEFQIESYLRYQGKKFVERFDANSYLYITRAIDYFDMRDGYDSLAEAFSTTQARFLFISFTSDWLYPPRRVEEMHFAAQAAGRDSFYINIDAPHGHDSFLLPNAEQENSIREFLAVHELKV